MYSNNIVNLQESTTILNACKKKVWNLIEGTTYLVLARELKSAVEHEIRVIPIITCALGTFSKAWKEGYNSWNLEDGH